MDSQRKWETLTKTQPLPIMKLCICSLTAALVVFEHAWASTSHTIQPHLSIQNMTMIKRKCANHTVMNTSCKVKEHMFIWSTCVLIFHLFPSLPFIGQGSIHRALLFILLQLRMDHQDICRVVPGHQFHDLSQSTSLGFTFGKLWDGMLQGGQPQHGYRVEAIPPNLLGHQLRMTFSERAEHLACYLYQIGGRKNGYHRFGCWIDVNLPSQDPH